MRSLLACGFLAGCGLLTTGCPSSNPHDDSTIEIALERVADGIPSPVALDFPRGGGGRLFVGSQTGQIWLIEPDGTGGATPFLDLSSRVVALDPAYDERGLLSFAFHPGFGSNGRVFVFYSAPPADPQDSCDNRLSEFVVDPGASVGDLATEHVLLTIPKRQANHNAGQLVFAPDGTLFLSVGDGGGAGDSGDGHAPGTGNAQDKTTLLGKIVRIDVDNGEPYAIPPDNPFAADPAARPEIFALGFRNPWRFSIDVSDATGWRLFAGDVGQTVREEVDIVVAGGNYGWRIREGSTCFNVAQFDAPLDSCSETAADGQPLRPPILEYGRDTGRSVIGGFVYRGEALPQLAGHYVFGDFTSSLLSPNGRLFIASEQDGAWSFANLNPRGLPDGLGMYLYAFGQDEGGELYVLTNTLVGPTGAGGAVYKLVPVGK